MVTVTTNRIADATIRRLRLCFIVILPWNMRTGHYQRGYRRCPQAINSMVVSQDLGLPETFRSAADIQSTKPQRIDLPAESCPIHLLVERLQKRRITLQAICINAR